MNAVIGLVTTSRTNDARSRPVRGAGQLQALGWVVHSVDNNMRQDFFGPDGDTAPLRRLYAETTHFSHYDRDIRDRLGVGRLVDEVRPALIVHCAAQPLASARLEV